MVFTQRLIYHEVGLKAPHLHVPVEGPRRNTAIFTCKFVLFFLKRTPQNHTSFMLHQTWICPLQDR